MVMLPRRAVLAHAFAAIAALFVVFAGGPAAAQAREGADYITGQWRITGGYSGGDNTVNFTAIFAADGTFVDRDNYHGRWVLSGSSFSMFYPDESQLGYVGVIQGDVITGRFEGADVAGHFRMAREGARRAEAPSSLAGSWTIDFDGPGGRVPWQVFADGSFREGSGGYVGTWTQSGSTAQFYVPSSGITHTGRIDGNRISGTYDGRGASGTFEMWR